MNNILDSIFNRLEKKKDYFKHFHEADARVEGWIKAELIDHLSNLKGTLIREFGIEIKHDLTEGSKAVTVESEQEMSPDQPPSTIRTRFMIDLRIVTVEGKEIFAELKTLCINGHKTKRSVNFYMSTSENDSIGLIKDFRKLNSIDLGPNTEKYIIAFIYPFNEKTQTLWEDKLLQDDIKLYTRGWKELAGYQNEQFCMQTWKYDIQPISNKH